MRYIPPAARLARYQSIAASFLPDDEVIIKLVKSLSHYDERWGGETYWQDGKFVIELAQGLPYEEESRLFFHELGHVVKGHVPKTNPKPATQLDALQNHWKITGQLAAKVQAEYDRREWEAEFWGVLNRAVHQAVGKIW